MQPSDSNSLSPQNTSEAASAAKTEVAEPRRGSAPSPAAHTRILSVDVPGGPEVLSPIRFEDAIQEPSLPYTGTHAAVDEKGDFKDEKMPQVDEPDSYEEQGRWGTLWLKLVYHYDIWYHYLKQRWLAFCMFIIAGVVSASIAIGWHFRLRTFNIADPDSFNNAVVQLSANLVDVDPSGQEMTLDWDINYACDPIGCPDVNLYFDANTLRSDSSGPLIPSNVKPDPVFTIIGDNVLAMRNNTDRRPSSLTFRTDVAITNGPTHRTLQSYPYDKYITKLVFFAEQVASNDSVSIAIVKTTGIAVGFNVQLQNITDVHDNFGTITKNIEVTRGPVVRVYAVFIVLVVWFVTLTFMATCVMNVFFGKGISSGVLVLPVGTLFAFTQLRSTLPGAPEGFGAVIDFVGVLPCLAILTFCSVCMTAVFLLRDPERDIPRWHWKEPGEGRRKSSYDA